MANWTDRFHDDNPALWLYDLWRGDPEGYESVFTPPEVTVDEDTFRRMASIYRDGPTLSD